MNKNGSIITYLPFKKYLIVVGIGILLYLIYYFYILNSFGLVSFSLPKQCTKNVIPERIWLDCRTPFGDNQNQKELSGAAACYRFPRTSFLPVTKWKDGSNIDDKNYGQPCHSGFKEGENINNIYCEKLYYSNIAIEQGVVQ